MQKDKLKILHINTERTWRGGEQQVFFLVEGLNKKGHENITLLRRDSIFSQRMKEAGFRTLEIFPWGEWDFYNAHFINKWLKKERIDVIHAHTAHGAALAVLATFGTKIPIVVARRVDFHLSKNPFSRLKYRRARKIIAISQGVQKVLIEDGIPEDKIVIVPSGVDFSRYEQVVKATHGEMRLSKEAIIVGQVAALADHKDQITFLKAMAILMEDMPEVRIVLVGTGELLLDLKNLVHDLKIETNVRFLGFQEYPLNFLAGFDVFCLSSKLEGLGTSILDAMALRIPVVATKTGGIPELIEDKVSGYLVDPQNPEKLALVVKKAIQKSHS